MKRKRSAIRRAWAILLLLALTLLSACGYLAVEEKPVQVGDAVVAITPQPTR